MPELKRNFLKGKMNKDLDERLVPNGEYRDALNIEISTSEGSNVGSAQIIRGNKSVSSLSVADSAITVGTYVDEQEEYIYNFVHKASDFDGSGNGTRSDAIIRYKKDPTLDTVSDEVVFTDAYETIVVPTVDTAIPAATGQTLTSAVKIYGVPSTLLQLCGVDSSGTEVCNGSYYQAIGIKPGMRVQAIDSSGVDLWADNDVRVVNASTDTSTEGITITPVVGYATGYTEFFGSTMKAAGVKLKFTADRILNFKAGTEETEINNKTVDGNNAYSTKQYTPKNNIITGINSIAGLLYWTDGRNEPKKINIQDFINGSTWSNINLKHTTRLRSATRVVPTTDPAEYQVYVEEYHTTVIKPSPTTPPTVVKNKTRTGATSGVLTRVTSGPSYNQNIVFYDWSTGSMFAEGSFPNQNLGQAENTVNWQVGDILELTGQTSFKKVKIKLVDVSSYGAPYFECQIIYIDPTYNTTYSGEQWVATLVEPEKIYKENFLTFAYRYKYADGETSVLSPYSTPVFAPTVYSYDAKTGFNKGMENNISSLEIRDFVPANMPEDVVEVEIVYRDTNRANEVISVAKIKKSDLEFTYYATGVNRGIYEINSEIFGANLPSDQVDRNEDHVPTTAVAQEITSSRLMYGNYTEAYDVDQNVDVEASLTKLPDTATFNSITSDNIFKYSLPSAINNGYNAAQEDRVYYVQYSVSNIIPTTVENEDDGDNFNTSTLKYVAPIDGEYTFEAEVEWRGLNKINLNPSGTSGYHYFVPAKLQLMKGAGVIVTTANSGSNAAITNDLVPANQENHISSTTDPNWDHETITCKYENISLNAGDEVYLLIIAEPPTPANLPSSVSYYFGNDVTQDNTPHSWVYTTSHKASINSAIFECTSAPQTTANVPATIGSQSIKTQRSYSVGIVYRDFYNRQSTVLISTYSGLNVLKEELGNINRIRVNNNTKPPSWAKYYKYFIKENTTKYYNLVLSEAHDNNDDGDEKFVWLAFNSSDVDKVTKDDYLILKKKHGTQEAVTSTNARWKVVDVSGSIPTDGSDDGSPIITNAAEAVGKFFVKIAQDTNFTNFFGSQFTLLGPTTFGAVFETEPKTIEQTDETSLYWEASQAYPIKLDERNAPTFFKVGSKVSFFSHQGLSDAAVEAIRTQFTSKSVRVVSVTGARTFSKALADTKNLVTNSYNKYAYCLIKLNKTLENIVIPSDGYIELMFRDESDGSYVVCRLGKNHMNTDIVYAIPYTCPNDDYPSLKSKIALPWYNCINFFNGVESDTIRDDFNQDTIHEYLPGGKASGLKASTFYEDYKKEYKANDVIFSQLFNEKTNYNRFNEFLIAKPIVKQLNPEYGSIQRFLTRDSDLLAFCEDKVVRILSKKDALFNADGNLQIVSSDSKVLGQAIPFRGDYGISKNPESLATDEYRVYFTDKARGSVLRLSMDGITVISDYGMKDWFFDNLEQAQGLIGSFDGKKDEYNLTVHSVTNPENSKYVYTLSFSEDVKGWTSFKSFIKESGLTLNNKYYTFKNGKPYAHHIPNSNSTTFINKFYNKQYDSSLTPLFNDAPGSIKSFATINYEGTQSKITQNTDSRDLNYYNINSADGWYVKEISTDLEYGEVDEFIEKEGKWFNKITGSDTLFDSSTSTTLDTSQLTVQGIGVTSGVMTVVSGSIDGYDFNFTASITTNNTFTSTDVTLTDITSTPGGTTSTFTLTPASEKALAASLFTALGDSTYYSSITFADSGTAFAADNTVVGTITWKTVSITEDINISINLSSVLALPLQKTYQSIIEVYHNKSAGDNVNFFTGFDNISTGSSYDSGTGVLSLNGGEGGGGGQFNFAGMHEIFTNGDNEVGNVFTFTYTVLPSSTATAGDLKIVGWGNCINGSGNDIVLNTAAGTHAVDITVVLNQQTNRLYINNFSTDTSRDAIISNIQLRRKVDTQEVVTFTNVHSSLTISADQASTSTTRSVFLISGTLDSATNHSLFNVRLATQGTGYYSTSPQIIFTGDSQDHSTSNLTTGYNSAGVITSRGVTVDYYAEDHLLYQDGFVIKFGSQSVIQNSFASFNLQHFPTPYTASSAELTFRGNGQAPTFAVISGSSWLSVDESAPFTFFTDQSVESDETNYIGSGTVGINVQAQSSGGAQREGVIAITSSYNNSGTPDDTITITQTRDGANGYINIFNDNDTSSPYVITTSNPPFNVVNDSVLGEIIPLSIYVSTDVTNLSLSDLSVTINTGDAGWLVLTSIEPSTVVGNFIVNYYVKTTDTSLYSRQATITATHPVNGGILNTQIIQQDMFNPAAAANAISAAIGSDTFYNFYSDGGAQTIEITSGQYGTPKPVVVESQTTISYGASETELTNSAVLTSDYDLIVDEVQTVTGQSYNYSVQITAPNIVDGTVFNASIPDGNVIALFTTIQVYNQSDYGFTTPSNFNIVQYTNIDELNPTA